MIARPTKSAVVPLVIKKELLIKYNLFKELTESLVLVLGPAIGGILAVTGLLLMLMGLSGMLAEVWGIQTTFYISGNVLSYSRYSWNMPTQEKKVRKYNIQ